VGLTVNTVAGSFFRNFVADTCRAAEVEKLVLMNILADNKNTDYGLRYSFAGITSKEEYKNAVPLSTYENYRKEIENLAAGETNILTAEPVKYFGLTSGTTGTQKMIPVTPRSHHVVAEHMGLLMQGVLLNVIPDSRRFNRGLMLMNMVTSGLTPAGIPTGAGTSGGMQSMKRLLPYLWTSPPEILEIKNQPDANYLHLLFALKYKNLMYIGATFASAVLALFKQLENLWPRLVDDVSKGRINEEIHLDLPTRYRLQKNLRPDHDRANELKKEFEQGFDGIARRIWPDLLYINSVAGGSFSIYVKKIQQYIADIPIYSAVYGSTEALIGISLEPGETTYVLTPRTAYHEFIPLKDIDGIKPQTLDLEHLIVGECYEVVVTSFAGLYRYRIGDIVKVVGYYNECPVIEFLYRKGQLLNLTGEKTSEQAVRHAVFQAAAQLGVELVDYTSVADCENSPGRYIFYLEAKLPAGDRRISYGTDVLEEALCLANPRYQTSRQAGKLGQPEVRVVRSGTFEELVKILMTNGTSANQLKIPRVVSDKNLVDFLNRNTLTIPGGRVA
jgi:hypothetical protein